MQIYMHNTACVMDNISPNFLNAIWKFIFIPTRLTILRRQLYKMRQLELADLLDNKRGRLLAQLEEVYAECKYTEMANI